MTGGTWYQTLVVQFFEDQNHQTFETNEVHSSKNSILCFDIWNEEEHGDRIDILNAFKRRTRARIEFDFNSQLEEDIEIHTES